MHVLSIAYTAVKFAEAGKWNRVYTFFLIVTLQGYQQVPELCAVSPLS
jgi:hypothetical protein